MRTVAFVVVEVLWVPTEAHVKALLETAAVFADMEALRAAALLDEEAALGKAALCPWMPMC